MDEQKEIIKILEERYKPVSTNPKDNDNYFFNSCGIGCVGIAAVFLGIIGLIVFNWIVGLSVFGGLLIICLIMRFKQNKRRYDSPAEEYAKRIKSFIGFDFGNNYKMWRYSSHDYDEFILQFESNDFIQLKEFGERESNGEKNLELTRLGYKIGEGVYFLPFVQSKDERRLHEEIREGYSKLWRPEGAPWWHTLEIDYQDKTLRFILVGF